MNLFRSTTSIARNSMNRSPFAGAFLLIPLALAIFTLPVDAAQIVDQPIAVSVPVVCNVGEVVDLSGRLHTVITFTRNSRHGIAHVHVNAQVITGTGEITGRTFQANGEWD